MILTDLPDGKPLVESWTIAPLFFLSLNFDAPKL